MLLRQFIELVTKVIFHKHVPRQTKQKNAEEQFFAATFIYLLRLITIFIFITTFFAKQMHLISILRIIYNISFNEISLFKMKLFSDIF